jgi:hypothetical protein
MSPGDPAAQQAERLGHVLGLDDVGVAVDEHGRDAEAAELVGRPLGQVGVHVLDLLDQRRPVAGLGATRA